MAHRRATLWRHLAAPHGEEGSPSSRVYAVLPVIPAKPRAARSSGRLSAAADQFTQRWDDHVRHAQPAAKIIPECDTEFGACLGQPQERVAAIPPLVTSRPGADLAPCDLAAKGGRRSG